MNNQTVWMLLTAGVLLPAGCGFGAPYKMSGPSLSGQGVEVGIAGVRCYVNREQDPFPDVIDQDQVDVDLRLQVKNNSSQDAEIAEGRIRLAEADLPAVGPATPEHSGVISVPPVGLIRFRGHPTKGGYRGKDGTPNEDTKGQAHIH
jgi:hypothetical protein